MIQLHRGAFPAADCARWRERGDAGEVLAALRASALSAAIVGRLGRGALCNLDQCWLRHQHPPASRPPARHPHSWHQDGALGHDFSLPADADGGLLEMLTCWIALDRCGLDAPGLAWIDRDTPTLLTPAELTDAALGACAAALVAPELDSGDALLFDGTLLHRTHVTAAMTRERKSFELRLFGAAPARLAGQRFVPFAAPAQPSGSKRST